MPKSGTHQIISGPIPAVPHPKHVLKTYYCPICIHHHQIPRVKFPSEIKARWLSWCAEVMFP